MQPYPSVKLHRLCVLAPRVNFFFLRFRSCQFPSNAPSTLHAEFGVFARMTTRNLPPLRGNLEPCSV